jgi:hypothetical protein
VKARRGGGSAAVGRHDVADSGPIAALVDVARACGA